jgi:Tfp pilus assembly protein PilW
MVTTDSIHARRTGEGGFSLVELLMASTISVAIMGSIVLVTSQLQRSYYSLLDGAAVQQEGRFAIDWIARTLVSAGNNPIMITVSPCPSTGNTFRAIRRDPNGDGVQSDIRIHSDLNGNGLLGGLATDACTEANEDITIALDTTNNTITKRDNNTDAAALAMTDTVITGLTFTYLDCNRATTALDAGVCFIRVAVISRTPTLNNNTGQQTTFTETAEVRVRTR